MADNTDNLSLEKLVREVDYKGLEHGYIPSKFALEFVNFVKLVNGGKEENISPLFHYKILDNIAQFQNNLFVSFRGSAKTSIMEYLILYLATFGGIKGFGKIDLGLYVGDTMENGAKNFRNNVEFRWRNSEFLRKFVPVGKFTDARLEFENAEGHVLIWKLYGASTGVRGVKDKGVRPKMAILDDLMSDKSATSKTLIADMEEIIYKAVRQALHPKWKKVVWIGTPFNKADPLYKAAGSSTWNTLAFPACEKFPCTKEEFVGAWEDRFSYEILKEEYHMLKSNGKIDAFNQELMLRILSDDDRLVLDEDILWYPRNEVLNNKQNYNFYITTDFATSEKESADFSVISVWALDYKGVFHWVDGVATRQDMSKNVDDLFRLAKIYEPLSVGIEISGQQKGFVSWVERDMQIRGQWFTLASDKAGKEVGLRPTTNKLTRFNTALPLFKQRLMAFPEELKESPIMLEFIDELTSVTPSGAKSLHDDCLDSVSMLQMLDYVRPHDPNDVPEEPVKRKRSKYFNDFPEVEEINSYII